MAKGTSASAFVNLFFKEVEKKGLTQEQWMVANLFFDKLKAELFEAIRNHPISQELTNHTAPSRILRTPGTLFGFLGLRDGSDPVQEIINIADAIMVPQVSRRLVRGGVKVSVRIPDVSDFRTDILSLEWEGGYGVVDGIEKGVSGLSNYLYSTKAKNSRSQEGVQVAQTIRSADFKGQGWLTPIFTQFKRDLKKFR